MCTVRGTNQAHAQFLGHSIIGNISHIWLWDWKISWPKSFDDPHYFCFEHSICGLYLGLQICTAY